MRNTWYGDNRDVVKWGALVHLAKREGIKRIVQVAFLRTGPKPDLETSQGDFPIAKEVWNHFRNAESIRGLGLSSGLEIQVISQIFDPARRKDYIDDGVTILSQDATNKIVLLDPDTGIKPQTARAEHVWEDEIRRILETLEAGDWLVVYQHSYRNPDWRDTRKQQFERVCYGRETEVFGSSAIANDVVFFATRK